MRTTLLMALGTVLLMAATSVVSAQETVPPPPEPAVDNSTIDTEPMPIAGPDGEWIRCPDGQLLEVTPLEWLNAPNLGESVETNESDAEETVYRATEMIVPRCGPGGGGSDGQPIFVPESVGADETVAPRRFIRQQR